MELKLLNAKLNGLKVSVLIVPYGIETTELNTIWQENNVLIVPYGIETQKIMR